MSQGATVNVSAVAGSPHVGTHADAPLHVKDGWPGAHELPLDAFCGPATVIDVSDISGEITMDALTGRLDGAATRLLLRTGRCIAAGVFPTDWPALTESCARDLLGGGVRLIGTDAPSVDLRESKSLSVHHMLFSGQAYILENLDLRRIAPGRYELFAFPQKLMGLDAAPVRAVLRDGAER